MSPLISVIIPAYNAANTVRDAVRSVRAQSVRDWELIIVDDGSTDDTALLVEECALNDDRIWVLQQENRGVSAARNTGIEASRGEWTCFLDADDWLLPGAFDMLLSSARHGGTDGACGRSALFNQFGRDLAFSTGPTIGRVKLESLLVRNQFQPSASIVRRSALGDLRFDTRYTAGEDWDLWLRAAERGVAWSVIDTPVAAYRLRPGGLSHGFALMAEQCRRIIERAFERKCPAESARAARTAYRAGRLNETRARIALHQATAAALNDATPDRVECWTILESHWPGGKASAAALGDAAYWMIPFADARAPSAWTSVDDDTLSGYAGALDALWRQMIDAGYADQGTIASAQEHLAQTALPPDEVAARIIGHMVPGRPVTILGLGANGRCLARALRARGIDCDAHDARFSPGAGVATIEGAEVRVHGPGWSPEHGRLLVMTPGNDGEFLRSLPPGSDPLRWSVVSRELSAAFLQRLRGAWPMMHGGAAKAA